MTVNSEGVDVSEVDAAAERKRERDNKPAVTPTQVDRPWRAVARTVIVLGIAVIPPVTLFFEESGLDTIPVVGGIIALGAVIQRAITLPEVEFFLQKNFPALAADVYRGKHRQEDKEE